MSSYSKTGNSALRQNNLLCFPKINLSVRNSVVLPAHPLTIMSICSSIHWFIAFNVYWNLNRRIAEILISQSPLYLFPLSKHSPIKHYLCIFLFLIVLYPVYPFIHPFIHPYTPLSIHLFLGLVIGPKWLFTHSCPRKHSLNDPRHLTTLSLFLDLKLLSNKKLKWCMF